ncbi:MAG: hypothetical protein H7A21_10785 [Spirochaetales bacterium]|nr:hypothetical protein [Leptospiraceae bacterium]MCP5481909.1 hypothetical protein [Spirochaetales bacterium]MCP5486285.1 hypothetical protein [Spirochaetales bacterium]
MRLRATKMIIGGGRIYQAWLRPRPDGRYAVEVEGIGLVAPLDFHMFGFKVEEAVSDEIEKLKSSGYWDWGRMAFPFEREGPG